LGPIGDFQGCQIGALSSVKAKISALAVSGISVIDGIILCFVGSAHWHAASAADGGPVHHFVTGWSLTTWWIVWRITPSEAGSLTRRLPLFLGGLETKSWLATSTMTRHRIASTVISADQWFIRTSTVPPRDRVGACYRWTEREDAHGRQSHCVHVHTVGT